MVVEEAMKKMFEEPVEDYLVTIYKLQKLYGVARTSMIAKDLHVRDGTVSKVLKHLEKEGYVTIVKYKGARLTPEGEKIASRILRNHRILEYFLHEFLGFDIFSAHRLAHRMEHLPEEVIDAIYRKIGMPKTCVYGLPLDEEKGLEKGIVTLDKAEVGCRYRITCLLGELETVLMKFKEVGCFLCCDVRVESKGSKGIVIEISPDKKLVLSLEEAKSIGVERLNCHGTNNTARSGPARKNC